MTNYRIVAGDQTFEHEFDGEPQINLTFEYKGSVYKVVTRAHDEDINIPMLHAERV